MKFIRVLKAKKDWKVEKISETDWIIKSPDGTYKNSNGKDYHFKTKEDALEELDYLRAEHKFDKKSSSQRYTVEIEDWGKSDIYEGKRDRMFYIYDNKEGESVCDNIGETIYYDNLEEAKDECEELNYLENK